MTDKPVIEAPVTVVPPVEAPKAAQVGDLNIAPTTTAADDLVTKGQRTINILWESTQSALAIIVTIAVLYVAGRLAMDGDNAALLLLSSAFTSVISVYLTRTNHTKTGGVKTGDGGR